MDRNGPIGMFDSGVGGLTVWKEIAGLLPDESIYYYADSKNCPYGPRTIEEVITFADRITDFLISLKCKLIVVACNTATAAAIDFLREKHNLQFVGMEPAIKPAALNTRTGSVGILATEGTFNGRLFKETSKKFATDKEVVIQIGAGLVELAEKADFDSVKARNLLEKYIIPMLENGVDYIVLGCTHYPFFKPIIEEIAGNKAVILDSAPAVAQRTANLLRQSDLTNNSHALPKHRFFSNGDSPALIKLVGMLAGDVNKVEIL